MKYFITILLFFISIVGFSQPYLGTPTTLTLARGHFRSDSGLAVSYNFADTISANLGILKNIPNLIIVANDTIYKRSTDLTAWRPIGGGGGTTIYTGDGTISADRILNLDGNDLQFNYNGKTYFRVDADQVGSASGIKAYNPTGAGNSGSLDLAASEVTCDAILSVGFNDEDHFALIDLHGTSTDATITYTADTHTFNIGNGSLNFIVQGGANGGNPAISVNGSNVNTHIGANDGNGNISDCDFNAAIGETTAVIFSNANGKVASQILLNGDAENIAYTANTHTFNGAIVQQFSTLTYGATTTWNMATGDNKVLTLTGDANLVFTGALNGNEGTLIVVQDGSGGHALTVPDQVVTINTGAGDTTVLGFVYDGGVYYWASSAGGGASWGSITGTLSAQTDLQAALDLKSNIASPTFTGTVTIPTPFTLGAVSVTTTGTRLNYLTSAGGTTGTTSTNIVFSTSPTLVTPTLGAATATSINGNTFTTGTYTLTGAAAKTLTFNNSITLTGTDATTMTFPTTTATIARTDAAQTFTGAQTFSSAPVISSITNTGTLTLPTVTGTAVAFSTASIASSATPAPTGDSKRNELYITALATAITTMTAPSGTPANGNVLVIRIKDNNTVRAIAFDGIYRGSTDMPLPSQTTQNKTMYCTFQYNSTDTRWDMIGFINNL